MVTEQTTEAFDWKLIGFLYRGRIVNLVVKKIEKNHLAIIQLQKMMWSIHTHNYIYIYILKLIMNKENEK